MPNSPVARLPFQNIAHQPGRLDPQAYPVHAHLRIRWSDMQDGRVSRVAMAHFFEDLRMITMRDLMGNAQVGDESWDSVLRAVTMEHLAPATLDFPCLDMAAGIMAIGKTSFAYALAAFQNGRCIAVGSSVDVRVESGQPIPFDDTIRAVLQRGLMPSIPTENRMDPKVPTPQDCAWSFELPVRFADTDAVGHLNNVTMLRYHDNAAMAFIREALGHVQPDAAGGHLSLLRQDVSLKAETHFPQAITLCVTVTELHAQWFTLALSTFQDGQCTTTSTATVAWLDRDDQAQPLPPQLLARLAALQAQTQ